METITLNFSCKASLSINKELSATIEIKTVVSHFITSCIHCFIPIFYLTESIKDNKCNRHESIGISVISNAPPFLNDNKNMSFKKSFQVLFCNIMQQINKFMRISRRWDYAA